MNLVFDQAERVGQFVAKEIGLLGFVPPYSAIGWERDGELKGGVVFHNYTGPSVEASVAWEGPLQRSVLRHVRRNVFEQNKCKRLTIHVRSERSALIKQAKRLGFSIEGYHRHFYGDGDGVSLGILDEECRW